MKNVFAASLIAGLVASSAMAQDDAAPAAGQPSDAVHADKNACHGHDQDSCGGHHAKKGKKAKKTKKGKKKEPAAHE